MVVRFELQLLSELGFGLDLEQLRGNRHNRRSRLRIAEIRARGIAHAGEPWRDKHVAPAGVSARRGSRTHRPRTLADGFALTGFFLTRHVLEPRGWTCRTRCGQCLIAALRRTSRAPADRNGGVELTGPA